MAQGISRSSVFIFALNLIVGSVQAGEVLRLKNGEINTTQTQFSSFSAGNLNSRRSHQNHRHYIVQFKDAVGESQRRFLSERGLKVLSYIPEDALVVEATQGQTIDSLYGRGDIQAIVPYETSMRVSEDVFEAAKSGSVILHVLSFDPKDSAKIASDLRQAGATQVHATEGRSIFAEVPTSKLVQVVQVQGAEWIEPYVPLIMHDFQTASEPMQATARDLSANLTGGESGTKIMNFDSAWGRGLTGKGQVVGVADTGLDTGVLGRLHSDFTNIIKGQGFGATGAWNDVQGHGTHVAGSIAGSGRLSNGKIKGGAFEAKLVIQGMWNYANNNLGVPSSLEKLFGSAYSAGARVHSNSWGSIRNAYDNFATQVDDFMWKNPEMLIVFANGNSGADHNRDGRVDNGSVGSPATAKNCLSVGASENMVSAMGNQNQLLNLKQGKQKFAVEPLASDKLSNNANGLAGFSSRGPTRDGRIKPDVVAPGTNILSTRTSDPKAGQMWGALNANYIFAGGTSMATPLTAGAAAVVREYLIEKGFARPTAALVKAVLMHSAYDLFPGQFGAGPKQEIPTRRPNVHEGYGRVNVAAATKLEGATLKDETQGVGLGEAKTYEVRLNAGQKMAATLVYTDAPGTASAAKALVNDLDITVVDPKGQAFSKSDRINNNEIIEIPSTVKGTYKVTVKGIKVPQGRNGKQPFALVVSTL